MNAAAVWGFCSRAQLLSSATRRSTGAMIIRKEAIFNFELYPGCVSPGSRLLNLGIYERLA
jgi:hypothetical protein